MQVVDINGNVFGVGLEVTGSDGKPKTIGGGGGPIGPAGGDLSGIYPNPSVLWSNGTSTYNSLYYPLSTNPSGFITSSALSPYLTSATAATIYQNILVSGTNIKTINSTTLLGSGDIAISSNLSIGTTSIASGTIGRVLFQGTGNVVQQSTNLFFDNINGRLGIGTSSPSTPLNINKIGSANFFNFDPSITGTAPYLQAFFSGSTDARVYFDSNLKLRSAGSTIVYGLDCGNILSNGNITLSGTTDRILEIRGSTNNYIKYTDAGATDIGVIGTADATTFIQIRTGSATNMSNGTLSTAFFSNGNVGINTITNAGFKLDVNGTARISGNLTLTSGTTATIGNIQIFDNTTGFREIKMLSNQGLQISANSTNIQINNSTGGNGNLIFNATGSGGVITVKPNGVTNGITFSGVQSAPSFNQITFANNRNDGVKSAIIKSIDFASSGATPVNMFIFAGKETILNNQANLILSHDGTTARGNTLIGTSTNVVSAIVNIESTTKGFLPPRMTTTQKNAIVTPAAGLLIYDSTLNKLCVFTTAWETITST